MIIDLSLFYPGFESFNFVDSRHRQMIILATVVKNLRHLSYFHTSLIDAHVPNLTRSVLVALFVVQHLKLFDIKIFASRNSL